MLKKYKIPLILLIVGIVIGYIIPNIIPNKNQYKIENDSLKIEIEKRNKENKKLDSLFNYLSKERIKLEINIEKRNDYIKILEQKSDSIDNDIKKSNNNLEKINKDSYEEINDVDSWDNNKRIHFFSEYFKSFN